MPFIQKVVKSTIQFNKCAPFSQSRHLVHYVVERFTDCGGVGLQGLFYSVIRGEVSAFRLARMSQRDMQATKVSEPNKKDTPEVQYNIAYAGA